MRKEVCAIITSTKTSRAKDMVPYTYKEIREIYRNFAGEPNELRMLMDFTALKAGLLTLSVTYGDLLHLANILHGALPTLEALGCANISTNIIYLLKTLII